MRATRSCCGNRLARASKSKSAADAVEWFSAAGTFGLLKLVNVLLPIKADEREEGLGLDVSQHGEEAYGSGEGAILVLSGPKAEKGLPLGQPAA